MKPSDLEVLIEQQLQQLADAASISLQSIDIAITKPKNREHGDYTTNVALRLSRDFSMKPMELATQLAQSISNQQEQIQANATQPGFINFTLPDGSHQQVITDILSAGKRYGYKTPGDDSILLEFVSANPTGPLHIGHGRGAAYGASLANVLRACGHTVICEYYINDAGRQMSILAMSLWLRYLQQTGHTLDFPSSGYKGTYLTDIAKNLLQQQGTAFAPDSIDYSALSTQADDDTQLDRLVATSRKLLGAEKFSALQTYVTDRITQGIRDDLAHFGVRYDNWYSEQTLYDNNKVEQVIDRLEQAGALYTEDGALWFRSEAYGDNKNRVVRRANGDFTYFATDISYHADKFERGYNRLINLFGADHHGYIVRLKAAMTALGYNDKALNIYMIQFANLIRGGEKISMSTRGGEFIELAQLVQETGVDAARFFYLMRRHEQHLDFDIDLATSQSRNNPVYYVQYAHARVSQIMQQAQTLDMQFQPQQAGDEFDQLNNEREQALLDKLSRFSGVIQQSGNQCAPHLICQYLRELAALFHNYYASVRILDRDNCWQARLALTLAVQQVLANGLTLLGVSAPEHM